MIVFNSSLTFHTSFYNDIRFKKVCQLLLCRKRCFLTTKMKETRRSKTITGLTLYIFTKSQVRKPHPPASSFSPLLTIIRRHRRVESHRFRPAPFVRSTALARQTQKLCIVLFVSKVGSENVKGMPSRSHLLSLGCYPCNCRFNGSEQGQPSWLSYGRCAQSLVFLKDARENDHYCDEVAGLAMHWYSFLGAFAAWLSV